MPNPSETVYIFELKFYMLSVLRYFVLFYFLSFSQNSRAFCKKKVKKIHFCYMQLLYFRAPHLEDGIC